METVLKVGLNRYGLFVKVKLISMPDSNAQGFVPGPDGYLEFSCDDLDVVEQLRSAGGVFCKMNTPYDDETYVAYGFVVDVDEKDVKPNTIFLDFKNN